MCVIRHLLNGNNANVTHISAVNQALGRCIRHIGDYGALFLVDSRYTSRRSQLARWLRDSFVVHNSFRDMAQDLNKFFEELVPQELKDKAKEAAIQSKLAKSGAAASNQGDIVFVDRGGIPSVSV